MYAFWHSVPTDALLASVPERHTLATLSIHVMLVLSMNIVALGVVTLNPATVFARGLHVCVLTPVAIIVAHTCVGPIIMHAACQEPAG